ncbi:MAG TPA: hypothetical protein ENF48_03585 [Desulfobacteraceae bacterium]|nr:hypothetical protein [Desulfobacteraceae bacterium]
MRIVMVHYHLKPGGVTSVIRRQAEALSGRADVLVVCGEPPGTDFPAPVAVVPGLAYDLHREPQWSATETADRIRDTIVRRWPRGCDLVHVHNPTLAKNRLLPEVLGRLQQRGLRLLLQIHDFAEDARPGAYSPAPYPADCHWAVLNRRDYDILLAAGLRPEGLHLLPNEVATPPPGDPDAPPGRHVLYPVRAIRRKNIGEAILLSLFMPPGHHLAVTLPPNSPADQEAYRFWRDFVQRHRLAVQWEVGLRQDFGTLVQTARFLITTSIAEGFGFAFLEPWRAGKWLWGRRLAPVCADFSDNGVVLDHLYTALQVPTKWLDRQRWWNRWQAAVAAAHCAFGRPFDPEAIRAAFQRLADAESVDFGLLDEPLQAEIVQRCLKNAARRDDLAHLNPQLRSVAPPAGAARRTAANAAAVARHYGREAIGRRLWAVYRDAQKPIHQAVDKARLLDCFLDLDQFSLLRWGRWTP